MTAVRRWGRLALLIGLLVAGLAIELLIFPALGPVRRERILRGWSKLLVAACGVRIEPHRITHGAAAPPVPNVPPAPRAATTPAGGCMLVANHRSWLDIFVINALMPAQFVAKAEIRRWPAIGMLCALAGTHFIERHRRHAVRDVIHRLVDALRSGRRVAIFPEGMVNDGTELLRFHANLVQAAIDAQAPVVPVALRYLNRAGNDSQAVMYVGKITFLQSLWQILGEPLTVARISILPEIAACADATRHAIARDAEVAIRCALGLGHVMPPRGGDAVDSRPARPTDRATTPQ